MTEGGKVQLEFTADASGVESAVTRAKRSLDTLADGVKQSASEASAALSGMGGGGDAAAANVEKTTARIKSSIERQIAAYQAGTKSGIDFEVALAKIRGIEIPQSYIESLKAAEAGAVKAAEATRQLADASKFLTSLKFEVSGIGKTRSDMLELQAATYGLSKEAAPLIAKIREAEVPMRALGVTGAMTANQLRMVAPQITDIATQLAAGANPMMVFVQQGGQLKDLFGGIGSAVRAVGQYIVSIINPFTVAAAAVGALAVAYAKGAAESAAFTKAIILTGNAAGTSASQLAAMSERMRSFGTTQGAAAAAVAEMAGSTRIAAIDIEKFSSVAIAMERTIGQAVADTRKEFEDLAKSPSQAILKLNDSYAFLTASTYRQITALEEQGRTLEAGALAQRTYADAMLGRTSQLTENLGLVQKAWAGIVGAAKSAWDAMLNVGRTQSIGEQIKSIEDQIRAAEGSIGRNAGMGMLGKGMTLIEQGQLDRLRESLAILQETARMENRAADAAGARAKAEAANIAWAQEGLKWKTEEQKREEEIYAIVMKGLAAGQDTVEINRMIAQYEAAHAKSSKEKADNFAAERENAKTYAKVYLDLVALQAKYAGETAKVTDAQKILDEVIASGAFGRMPQAWQDVITEMAKATDETQRLTEAERERVKAEKELADLNVASVKAETDRAKALQDAVQRQKDENATLGMSAAAQAEYNVAKAEAVLIDLERKALVPELSQAELTAINQQIDAQRQLVELMKEGATKRAAVDAAKEAATEWKRTSDTIEKSLTDALLRGFEAGKSFGQNFIDTLKNMFKTLVLKPVISFVLSPITGAITAALSGLGLSGAATAATTGSNALSLGSGAAALSTFGTGVSNGLSAWGAGGSVTGMWSNPGLYTGAELFGSALPIIGAAAIAYALYEKIKSSGETRTGSTYGYSSSAGTYDLFTKPRTLSSIVADLEGPSGGPVGGAAGGQTTQTLVQATVDSINSLFTRIGSSEYVSQFWAKLETSTEGRGGVMAGGVTSSGKTFGFGNSEGNNYAKTQFDPRFSFSPDASTAIANFTTELKLATLDALKQATDIPAYFKNRLASIDITTLTDEQATAILTDINTQVDGMEKLRGELKLLGLSLSDLGDGAIEAAGSYTKAGDIVGAYYEATRSDAEKLADATGMLSEKFQALGYAMPTSMEDYRALIESLQHSSLAQTESGQALIISLMALAPAMKTVTDATNAAADAATNAADKIEKAFAGPSDWITFASNFGSAAELTAAYTADLTGKFSALGYELPKTRGEYIRLVNTLVDSADKAEAAGDHLKALDFSDAARKIIGLGDEFGAFLDTALQDVKNAISSNNAMASFYKTLIPDKATLGPLLQTTLNDSFAQLNIPVPKTAQEYIDVVNAESDPARRELLMGLAQPWVEVYGQAATDVSTGISGVGSAASNARAELKKMVDSITSALKSISDFVRGLMISGDTLKLTPAEQLANAQAAYDKTLAQAKSGDLASLQSVPEVAKALLDAANAMYASTDQFQLIRDAVLAQLNALTGTSPSAFPSVSKEGRRGIVGTDDSAAYRQRGAQVEILQSMDRRLARMESATALASAR